jgi:drug/metabolite transporter (DMT)-like permease
MVGPSKATVYTNLVPIFTAILAVLILGEDFALYHALALALVIGGIMLTQRGSRSA